MGPRDRAGPVDPGATWWRGLVGRVILLLTVTCTGPVGRASPVGRAVLVAEGAVRGRLAAWTLLTQPGSSRHSAP